MGLKGKKKDKHNFLMLYDDYRNSVLLSAAGHTVYAWDEIESGKYFIQTSQCGGIKHAHYYDDINVCISNAVSSEAKSGLMVQRVPGVVCGGYELDAISYEAELASVTGYYDVISRINASLDNGGISYLRCIPYTGKEIDIDSVKNVKHTIDVATAEFPSTIDTVKPNGDLIEDANNTREKRVYQAAFMLAYNGCRSICFLPCSIPYEGNGMTEQQGTRYASLVARTMITLTQCVDEWHIYTAGIPQEVFAKVMYGELIHSGMA